MNRFGLFFLVCVVLIFSMGLVMIFNTTSAEVLDRFQERSTHHAFVKQLLYALAGGVCAFGVFGIGHKTLLKLSPVVLGTFILLLVLVLIPGVGQNLNGARRWISFFGNSLQPSEFVKYLIPLYYIHYVSQREIFLKDFLKVLCFLAIPLGLILIEPDNGTVAIILIALLVLFILTGLKWTYWLLPLSILCLCGSIVASQMPHVSDRIQIYLHPELDLRGKGHQPYQAKIAAGSGKLWGRGVGESLQKLEYLPEARSDYIAAIFAEETGFIGIFLLILLYMGMGFAGFRIAQGAVDQEGFLVAGILTFLLCFQAFLNLGIVSGLLPSKGTHLPFFSQGGSSLLANMIAVSILLSIAQGKKRCVRS